jgi:hypothetical protein
VPAGIRMATDALTKRILDFVRTNPGCTTSDILDALPRHKPETVWLRVVDLSYLFEIENRGGSGRHEDVRWHILEWQPTEFYLEMASDMVKRLKDIPPRKKALYLARQMQQVNEDTTNTETPN